MTGKILSGQMGSSFASSPSSPSAAPAFEEADLRDPSEERERGESREIRGRVEDERVEVDLARRAAGGREGKLRLRNKEDDR